MILRLLLALLLAVYPFAASSQTITSSSITSNPTAFAYPASYGAAGVAAATTGTGTISTNQIVVASATGWLPGMGIAVHNGGTGGNTELITTVTSISGTTFTLATTLIAGVITQAVNHDDTAALTSCINSGKQCYGPPGTYNTTSTITPSGSFGFIGAGELLTIVQPRSTTADTFDITSYSPGGGLFQDFAVLQSGTASGGYAFNIEPTGGNALSNFAIKRVFILETFGGIQVQAGLNASYFSDIWIYDVAGTYGVYYNNPTPNGDNYFNNVLITAAGSFGINSADTFTIDGLKINVAGNLVFTASAAANVTRVRVINPSIEGAGTGLAPSCGIDFGTNGATQVQIIGGGVGLLGAPICNMANALNSAITDLNMYLNTGPNGRLTIPGCAGAGTSCVVANLPTCSTTTRGAISFVTDQATTPSWHGAVTGSGSTEQAVICNGSAWVQQ